jgi:hypothetical protein
MFLFQNTLSGESLFVINSTHYISKTILYQTNNDAGHISEKVIKSLHREVKLSSNVNDTELQK